MHQHESIIKGVQTNRVSIERDKFFEENNMPVIDAPRKVLPISPMNIFDGCQFHLVNINNEPTKGKYSDPVLIENTKNRTDKQEDTSPSIPSIKLIKLIIATPQKIKKKLMRNNKKLFSIFNFKISIK